MAERVGERERTEDKNVTAWRHRDQGQGRPKVVAPFLLRFPPKNNPHYNHIKLDNILIPWRIIGCINAGLSFNIVCNAGFISRQRCWRPFCSDKKAISFRNKNNRNNLSAMSACRQCGNCNRHKTHFKIISHNRTLLKVFLYTKLHSETYCYCLRPGIC